METKKKTIILTQICLIIGLSLTFKSCSIKHKSENIITPKPGDVVFKSSDEDLQKAWIWAKQTALSYVRVDSAIGLWYEAALPGRDAFCMRDVSHQANGAVVLGLQDHTKNMLFRFAQNISESKDWCSYWEINKHNLPAPVDYKNDKDFWYNLPANFDVIDACFRMYVLTADQDYINHPVFKNFYDKSLFDYVNRWNLNTDQIFHRNRVMNLPEGATRENHHTYDKRGIPGYHEGAGGKMQVGIDLLAAQYAAYNWYHYFYYEEDENSLWLNEAKKIDSLLQHVFWDKEEEEFRIIMYEDGSWDYSVGVQNDFSHSLLHFRAIDDSAMLSSILNKYSKNKQMLIIELASHMPDIFFRYGRSKDGIFMLKHLTDSSTHRREYPENPFSVCGAFASGLMGVNMNAPKNFISTFSGFTDPEEWGLMEKLPFAQNTIDILHQGGHTSVLSNHTPDTLFWQAFMEAGPDLWFIRDEPTEFAGELNNWYGKDVVSWFMTVAPGETVSVSAFPPIP